MKLNLGSGRHVKKDYINLDIVKFKGVDVVHNINKFPWPFANNKFSEVLCSHVLEHVDNFNKAINEIWRISKPGAIINIYVPYYVGLTYASDPSHKRVFTYRSMDHYAINPYYLKEGQNLGTKAKFKILKIKIIFAENKYLKRLNFLINPIINRSPLIYERFFFFFLPAANIYYKLKVVKKK